MAEALKYKGYLLQSDEEKESQDVQFKVEDAQQQLSSDILATKRSLAAKKREREQIIRHTPFDASAVINHDVSVAELEDGLARLKALEKELF